MSFPNSRAPLDPPSPGPCWRYLAAHRSDKAMGRHAASGSNGEAGRGPNCVGETLAQFDRAALPDHATAELAIDDAPWPNHACAPIRNQVCTQVLSNGSAVDCRANDVYEF
jgi:hypothetical protein